MILTEDGGPRIEGQDLRDPGREYEYVVTVAPEHVPLLRQALGGDGRSDPAELLERHGAGIVRAGERRWLRERGIESELRTHREW
ncbi:hypothetical protein ACWCXH_20110 [Kitasatospora sp. NPDC001660]